MSQGVLKVNQGSLYPALHRLEEQAWIDSDWGNSEHNRKAKFYRLTRKGARRLEFETSNWERLAAAITYAAAPVVLLAAALAAGWLPARRAARVDPAAALRCD